VEPSGPPSGQRSEVFSAEVDGFLQIRPLLAVKLMDEDGSLWREIPIEKLSTSWHSYAPLVFVLSDISIKRSVIEGKQQSSRLV
jgi:hypothetical protein